MLPTDTALEKLIAISQQEKAKWLGGQGVEQRLRASSSAERSRGQNANYENPLGTYQTSSLRTQSVQVRVGKGHFPYCH